MLLLPLLVTALQMQFPSEEEVARAFADGIRAKLVAGWTIVDMHGDYDGEVSMTLVKGNRVEAHVVILDEDANHSYRIDGLATVPAHPIAPSAFVVRALGGDGGIDFGGNCGRVEPEVYRVEASARGHVTAAKLVAETLKASLDVEGADVEGNRATFYIDIAQNEHAQLRVELDDRSRVIAAELRHYENGPDVSTYEGQARMQQKIGTKITTIENGERGVVLRGDKWFEIVPGKFERHAPEVEGCDC